MPRKTLAKWIVAIGVLEILLLNLSMSMDLETDLITALYLLMPTIVVSVIWWKKPKGSWISSLFFTWLVWVIAPMIYSTFYWGDLRYWVKDLWVVAFYAAFFGTIFFTALMVPVGIVYAATSDMFKSRANSLDRDFGSTPTQDAGENTDR